MNGDNSFTSTASLLQKTRSGHFLNLHQSTGDEMTAFAASVATVLRREYGVPTWPSDAGCRGEFETNVRSLFGATARAYANTLDNTPPAFSNPSRTIQSERRPVDMAISLLTNFQGGWCSGKGRLHPYLVALPKLLAQFDSATALATDERRNLLRTAYLQKQAKDIAVAQANEQAKQAQAAQKADTDRQARESQQAAERQRETYERGAAGRNAHKIRALGLPPAFLASTLYSNYMGQWSPVMPATQWVGLLLENKKIASIEAISVKGYHGVSVKRVGQPAAGILFRLEGKDAYVFGVVTDGRFEQIRSPAEHSQMHLLLKAITYETAIN